MDLGLHNKWALVTGASAGIGLAIARMLAEEGARVVISARREEKLEQAVEEMRLAGGEAFAIAADVSSAEGIHGLYDRMVTRYDHPEVLVVNAGGPPRGAALALDEAQWREAYDLTLMSAVRLARRFLPAMQERSWGRIINVTSVSIKQPVKNLALSNAYRAAVTGFAKTLSSEVAAQGITVNSVGPGYTDTARLNALFPDDEAKQRLAESLPMGRLATPEEVAAVAVFLASKQAAYMTGQSLMVDGGVIGALY